MSESHFIKTVIKACRFIKRPHVKGILAIFFICNPFSASAELSVSYALGNIFVASYEVPTQNSNQRVRLASESEYIALGADLPNFYNVIDVIDRSVAVGELFLSTTTFVSDPMFELVFMRYDNSEVINRYRIEVANERLVIQEVDILNTGRAQTNAPRTDFVPYNAGNGEVVALLSQVSRQLSEARRNESIRQSEEMAIDEQALSPEDAPDVQSSPTARTNLPTVSSHNVFDAEVSTERSQGGPVVSEVSFAVADLKNFILTIIVVFLALVISVLIVLYKTREFLGVASSVNATTAAPVRLSDESTSASISVLSYLKEENQRNQERLLKTIELLALRPSSDGVADKQNYESPSESSQSVVQKIEMPFDNKDNAEGVNVKSSGGVKSVSPNLGGVRVAPTNIQAETIKRHQVEIRSNIREKLDLAEVYKNMGDIFVAQSLLQEVINTGNEIEVARARDALQKIAEA